jgi:hypothetical protein
MKKEVIIAIISGLVLGLVITMGIYTANQSLNVQRAKKLQQNAPTPITPPLTNNQAVNVTSHENFDLVENPEQTLSGVAWPEAVVALIGDGDTQLVQADAEGIFTFSTRLLKGFNEISVIASDENGVSQTQNLVLTYSTNKIERLSAGGIKPVYAAEETASAEADSLTDKIKERLQDTAAESLTSIKEQLTQKNASPRKKAYIGKLASLNQFSLTLTYKDQHFNVNTTAETVYVKGVAAALNREALNPGDFVIAMGWYLTDREEFTAVRVSKIAVPEPPLSRQLIFGKISEIDGQKISFGNKTITINKKTTLAVAGLTEPKINDLALGDNLFAIVTLDTNGNIDTVNNVFVIPGKNNPAGLIPTNIDATVSAESSPAAGNAQ